MAKAPKEQSYPFPYSEDAETAVIGSIIVDPDWLGELDLDPDDFFIDSCRLLYQAILSLKERGEHIDTQSVSREAAPAVPAWEVPRIVSQMPTSMDCGYHAQAVKNYSRKRALIALADRLSKMCRDETLSYQQAADEARAALETMAFTSKTSRWVTFSNPRIFTSEPPIYLITVASINDKKGVDIKFTSTELDNQTAFKRKIREKLGINPILPKTFDSLVHTLVKQAKVEFAPTDASGEEQICLMIRDWFKSAVEAQHVEDMTQGYIDAEGAYWFQSTKMLRYLSKTKETKLSASTLGALLLPRGLRRMRAGNKQPVFRLGESTVRCWGLPKKFFEAEQEETIEPQQMKMEEEKEDLSWLDD